MTTPRPDLAQLADLDAGVLEPAQAAQVRAAAAAHPESAAVLHALAATRGELAELPAPPVPPEFAARWAAALEAEARPVSRVRMSRSARPLLSDRRRPARRRPRRPRAPAGQLPRGPHGAGRGLRSAPRPCSPCSSSPACWRLDQAPHRPSTG